MTNPKKKIVKKKIQKMEYLVTRPSESTFLTMDDLGEYLFHLTTKLNEIIEIIEEITK